MLHGCRARRSTQFAPVALLLVAGCGADGSQDGSTATPAPAASPPSAGAPACPAEIERGDIIPAANAAQACDISSFDTYTDVVYAPHARGLLDLVIPRNLGRPAPLVVWVHGGGWQSGDKSNRAQAQRLACRGYALAAVNYRLSDTATFPAQIHDVQAAIRFLRANAPAYGLDGTRIAVFGSSAGGHLAALAGTSADTDLEDTTLGNAGISSRVQATIDWYGPTRFSEMDTQLLAQGCPAGSAHHSQADSAESRLLGCPISAPDCADAVHRADPSSYADASDAPMLLLHGDADCTVPMGQSDLLADVLAGAGACAISRRVVGAGHGGPAWTSTEVQETVADFLDRVLK